MALRPALPPRRRLILQVVLILILCGTLGLAAWVRHARVGPSGIPLTVIRNVGVLKMRLPAWELDSREGTVLVATEAQQPGSATPGRVLEILQGEVDPKISPQQFVAKLFRVKLEGPTQPIRILGIPGVLFTLPMLPTGREGDPPESDVIASAVLPTGLAVIVHLRVRGREPDEHDIALVRQVAMSLQLANRNEGRLLGLGMR
jgi:hypothetical protein